MPTALAHPTSIPAATPWQQSSQHHPNVPGIPPMVPPMVNISANPSYSSNAYGTPYHVSSGYDKDPMWPTYNENDTFIDWLEIMLIMASSSCKHQHLVIYNLQNNQLEFCSSLNQQDNILLYKTLLDGLPPSIATTHASTLYRTHHHHDGLALLARL